jgi:threonine dehydratase
MEPVHQIPIENIRQAKERLVDIRRTPLIPFEMPFEMPTYSPPSPKFPKNPPSIHLKCENLQITGSFKVRGAGNAIKSAGPRELEKGVWTASAGNMGLGVAWHAKNLGISCRVVVPDDAPTGKIEALERLNATVVPLPREGYWQIQKTHQHKNMEGFFIHPFCNLDVMAGNGTIALEILEDLPDVENIIVPYGGGGLSCGIGSAIKAIAPHVKLYASETENGAPLAPSLATGEMATVPYSKSFVSGMGSPKLFDEMWPLAYQLIDGAFVVPLAEMTRAIRELVRHNHLVAEGSGATSVAAANLGHYAGAETEDGMSTNMAEFLDTSALFGSRHSAEWGLPLTGKTVCVISGGNIDNDVLAGILQAPEGGLLTPAL